MMYICFRENALFDMLAISKFFNVNLMKKSTLHNVQSFIQIDIKICDLVYSIKTLDLGSLGSMNWESDLRSSGLLLVNY